MLKVWPNYWKIVGKICTSRKPALHKLSVPVCGEHQRVRCQQSSGELGVSVGYYVFMKSKASQMKKKEKTAPKGGHSAPLIPWRSFSLGGEELFASLRQDFHTENQRHQGKYMDTVEGLQIQKTSLCLMSTFLMVLDPQLKVPYLLPALPCLAVHLCLLAASIPAASAQ